jgi:hypothetical protein
MKIDNKENKTSVLKEALVEYTEIKEAADRKAKQELAKEFPEKFEALLKEELQKNNKESDKKTDNINESDMKKNIPVKKETKKPLKEGEELDMSGLNLSEVEQAYDNAGEEDQFNISLEDIEKEISEMEEMSQKMGQDALPHGTSNEYEELKRLYEEIGQILADKDGKESSEMGTDSGVVAEEEAPVQPDIDQLKAEGRWQEVAEMYEGMMNGNNENVVPDALPRMVKQTEKSPLVAEDNVDTDKFVSTRHSNAPSNLTMPKEKESGEQVVDEILSQSLSANKQVSGNQTPRAEGAASFKEPKLRYALQHEAVQKKFAKLLEENKKVIKNLNETKASFKKANTLVEGYKSALDKYRKQLTEMAVFNSNLANVNNLLVNEELALTSDDKVKIITEFKKINSITESKKKYTQILSEMKKGQKTISEGLEEKVTVSVQPSSKQKLDEVTEKTAYQDNTHLNRIKHLMESLDKRNTKNNI